MSFDASNLPSRFFRTPEAARFLGLSSRTLKKHRTCGTGPVYHKLGGCVVYAIDELQAWADQGSITSTSDPKGSVPRGAGNLPAGVRASAPSSGLEVRRSCRGTNISGRIKSGRNVGMWRGNGGDRRCVRCSVTGVTIGGSIAR